LLSSRPGELKASLPEPCLLNFLCNRPLRSLFHSSAHRPDDSKATVSQQMNQMSRPLFRLLFWGAIIYATKCPAEARVQDTGGIDFQSTGRFLFRNFVLYA